MAKAALSKRNAPKTGPGSPERFKGRPRGPGRFKQRDVARAVRAAQQAGGVARVEVALDGHIHLILAEQAPKPDSNPWDEVHAANEKRPA